jgi:hypothetical protein
MDERDDYRYQLMKVLVGFAMTPTEVGFDGKKGFRMPAVSSTARLQLLRGNTPPSENPDRDFTDQLIWYYPDGTPARLLWCNAEDQWFEVSFTPTEKP